MSTLQVAKSHGQLGTFINSFVLHFFIASSGEHSIPNFFINYFLFPKSRDFLCRGALRQCLLKMHFLQGDESTAINFLTYIIFCVQIIDHKPMRVSSQT